MKEKLVFLILCLVFVCNLSFAQYDPLLPASNTKLASYPAIIREQLRSLKDDGIVNAGLLASNTPDCFAASDASNIDPLVWNLALGKDSSKMDLDGSNASDTVSFPGLLFASGAILLQDKDLIASPSEGLVGWNSSTKTLCVFDGSEWVDK